MTHNYTFYYAGNRDYADGWDRIFGEKDETQKDDQARPRKKSSRGRKSGTNRKAKRSQSRQRRTQSRDDLTPQVEGSGNS